MFGQDVMGYDRVVTVFSPDGRLFQVHYATEAVKKGATVIGLVAKDGVVLAADKRINSKLLVPSSVEKIFSIPGLGQFFVTSVANRDYTVILGVTVFYGTLLVTMNILVDLIYMFLDPRIVLHKQD